MLTKARLALLQAILSQSTAPFREHHVYRYVTHCLDTAGVPWFQDPAGNLVLGVASQTEYARLLRERSDEPVRLFIAHMDHPGFHGERWLDERRLAVRWHGGSPVKHMNGAKVWIANEEDDLGEGVLSKAVKAGHGYAIDTAIVKFSTPVRMDEGSRRPAAMSLFGGLAFRAPCWISGQRIYARAIDDLAGVFTIVSTAMDLAKKGQKWPFIGLLTRGEEVGFVGAVAHFELGWLERARRPLVCVSLEASRNLPGARPGKGPIVRLGDRRTTFDPSALQVLAEVAQKVLPNGHQKRIMDGGSCEATAATAWGLPTVGMTLPLGNYHNQGLDGGMDCPKPNGPAPEFVNLNDINGLLSLIKALMKPGLPWNDPWGKTRSRLRQNRRQYQKHLYPKKSS
jgi:putative aminopeptidase FrvX